MSRKASFERSALFSVLIVAAFFLVFVGGGAVYLFYETREIIGEKSLELAAIGKLKIEQVHDWRRERISDARFAMNSIDVAREIRRLTGRRFPEGSTPPPVGWMRSMYGNGHYKAIRILRTDRTLLASIPPPTTGRSHLRAASYQKALETRTALVDDITRHSEDDVCLHVYAPIFDPNSGTGSAPIAMVVFEIDPQAKLYELTRKWPVPSTSSEVILFRVEEDSVVYLNETNLRIVTPVTFKLPVTDSGLPAAWGARGNSGVFEGRDYRGVDVISYVAPVPDSPWLVVAKIDRSEALKEIGEQTPLVGVVVLLGTLLSAAGIVVLRRESARRMAVEHLEAERKLTAVRQHHADIMKHANDIIILSDSQDRILEANQMACDVYGYSLEELIGREVMSLRAESQPGSTGSLVALLRARSVERYETVHKSKDGRLIPVEVSLRMFTISGVSYIQRIIRDISERKAFEKEILRLNRMYHVLSDINQLIVRERDERRMFAEVCRIATEKGGFLLAWIGRTSVGQDGLVPIASDGPATRYLADLRNTAGPDLTSWGVASQAVREGKGIILPDLVRDEDHPIRAAAARREGIRSAASFPLAVDGKPWGAISFYAAESGSFNDDEVRLLDELASDLSYALTSIESDRQRVLIDQNSQRQRELLDEMGRMAEVGGWEFDTDSLSVVWTDELVKIFDMEPGATIDVKSGLSYYTGASRGIIEQAVTEAIHHGTPWDLELEFLSAKKVRKWVRVIGHPVHEHGKVTRVRGTLQDITKRREHEQEVLRLNRTYKVLSNINQLLVRAADEHALLEEACRIAVADGGYALVWIGKNEPGSQSIVPLVSDGPESEYLSEISVSTNPTLETHGPTAEAFLRGRSSTCQDIETDPRMGPWRGQALRHGFRSSAAFPIKIEGSPWGAISFYAAELAFFNDNEVRLLDELASDISFALTALKTSERKAAAEKRLTEREAQYRALFESSPDALIILEPNGRIREVNDVAVQRYQYSRAELLQRSVHDLASPELRNVVNDRILATFGGEVQFEWTHVRKDGSPIPVEVHAKEIVLGDEKLMLASVRDISERKKAEETLRSHETLLREMGRIAKVGAWEFDTATMKGTWTEEVARIHDLDPTSATSVEIGLSFYTPESRSRIEHAISKAIDEGKPYDLELEMNTASGIHKWVRTIGRPEIQNEKVVRVRGSFQDITERKANEEKLRHSEERFRSMVEQAGAGYFFIDLEGRYRHVNAAWLAMHKYGSPEEVLGRHFEEMQEESNRGRAHEIVRGIFRNDPGAMTAEFSRKCKDGSIGYHTYSSRMVSVDGQPVGIEGFLIDTTERRKVEERLEEQLDELRRWYTVSLDREERVQSLKHEVNTLLAQAGSPPRYTEPETPHDI